MIPSNEAERVLQEIYGAERVAAILDQFKNAEGTIGTQTMLGEIEEK